eukprot:scaffold5030_cov56-Phaeocystis_antarctica.AAC.2
MSGVRTKNTLAPDPANTHHGCTKPSHNEHALETHLTDDISQPIVRNQNEERLVHTSCAMYHQLRSLTLPHRGRLPLQTKAERA